MARLFDDALSQFLEIDVAAAFVTSLSMSCWFRSDDITIAQVLMGIFDKSASNNWYRLLLAGNVAGDPLRAETRDGGATGIAATTTGYSANTWHHACGVWTGPALRDVYIDGGSKGTEGTFVVPAGLDRTSIGRSGDTSPDRYMSGRIAEPCIWVNVALTLNEILALARGVKPNHIRPLDIPIPSGIAGYWPLWGLHSPEIDVSRNGLAMIVTGATPANHAPVTLFTPALAATVPLIEGAVPPPPPANGKPRFGQVITKSSGQPQFGQPITRSDDQPEFGQVITRTDDLPKYGQVIVQSDGEPEFGQVIVVPTEET